MNNLIFDELNISDEIKRALNEMGFEEATPIQSMAIPQIIEGRDIIAQAQTGTGKTCAFGIPAVEMISSSITGPQVLILCPTRELAIQVSEEIKNVSKFKSGIKVLPIYGGQSIDRQIIALKKKPQIIVGTPGRIMDHMRRRTLRFNNLSMLILDEADEMLNMGFREDIDIIVKDLPKNRQTLLFSATLSKEIKEIAKLYQDNPEQLITVHKELTIPSIEQYYIEVRESSKLELLCRLTDVKNVNLGLVFCNTKKRVDELASSLQTRGYSAEALHGDMKQAERDRVMKKFRNGSIDILVATDVAARGIDVNNIEAVFNYDIPSDVEYYVHRIGRTARAGKKGVSYSFVFGRDIYKLKDIQKFTKSNILPMQPPSISDIEEMKLATAINKVLGLLKSNDYSKYNKIIDKILFESDDATSLDVASVLFKLAFDNLERKYESSDIDDDLLLYSKDDMVRLFINVGALDRIKPKNILQGILDKSSLSAKQIGDIDIHKQFSFIEVPMDYVDEVLASNFTYKGRRIKIERASKRNRPKRNRGSKKKS